MNKKANLALWAVQVLLALIFFFTGGMKVSAPLDVLAKLSPLPGWFLKFIGSAELAGAFGLVLPGLLGVRRNLTPLAASGLVAIMAGAVTVTLASGGGAMALMPLAVGCLASLIAWGRMPAAPVLIRRREANA